MRTYKNRQFRIVKHNGVLKMQYRYKVVTYTDPSWYKFWAPITKTVEYSEPWYEEIGEINDE